MLFWVDVFYLVVFGVVCVDVVRCWLRVRSGVGVSGRDVLNLRVSLVLCGVCFGVALLAVADLLGWVEVWLGVLFGGV